MSGHSKWSTIKRQKGLNDAKRGQIFTKLANAITIATREGGGGDPANNIRLRLAIEIARGQNMPKDNIDRAIDRGLGKSGGAALENVTYEGFGPAGIAIIVSAFTDNRNRTTAEVKTTFDKAGGSMGQPGSVSWQFEQVGEIVVERGDKNPDDIVLTAIDAGASDVKTEDDVVIVTTKAEDLNAVREQLVQSNLTVSAAQLVMHPTQTIEIIDTTDAAKVVSFIERMEDLDDVNDVYTNADMQT